MEEKKQHVEMHDKGRKEKIQKSEADKAASIAKNNKALEKIRIEEIKEKKEAEEAK